MKYQEFLQKLPNLPEEFSQNIKEKFEEFNTSAPIRLALVGSFSVGKSSLLNVLLGNRWLHTAQEEATALPTFIEYAEKVTFKLITQDNSEQLIDEERFHQVTTNAPDNAKMALLGLPNEWLKNAIIIDLPGLGSISSKHHDYTTSQIQQADAVLYLLPTRGPTAEDINAINLIQTYGKHLLVVVNRWDEVEKSIALGEKAPDLLKWSEQIQDRTGYQNPLIATSFNGLNHEKVLSFVEDAKSQILDIRTNIFVKELLLQLNENLSLNKEQQTVNAKMSEDDIFALQNVLLEKDKQILQAKQALYQQQEVEKVDLDNRIAQMNKQAKSVLKEELINIQKEDWSQFINEGSYILRLNIANHISQIQEQVQDFGQAELPEAKVKDLNLNLPEIEPIDYNAFLQAGQLTQLKYELETIQLSYQKDEKKLHSIKVSDEEIGELESALKSLSNQRNDVMNEKITMHQQCVYDDSGAKIGRNVGHAIDTVLFFIPAAAVTKAGKAIKMSSKAISTIHKVQKTAQAARQALNQAIPSPEINVLDLLSASTWGEKIGSFFDEPPRTIETEDPEEKAEQERILRSTRNEMDTYQNELDKKRALIQKLELTGKALEQKELEMQRIQFSMQQLADDLAKEQAMAETDAIEKQQRINQTYRDRAIEKWLNQFDSQIEGMNNFLTRHLRGYWEDVIANKLSERKQEIDDLKQQLTDMPQKKEQMLVALRQEQAHIAGTLQLLS